MSTTQMLAATLGDLQTSPPKRSRVSAVPGQAPDGDTGALSSDAAEPWANAPHTRVFVPGARGPAAASLSTPFRGASRDAEPGFTAHGGLRGPGATHGRTATAHGSH